MIREILRVARNRLAALRTWMDLGQRGRRFAGVDRTPLRAELFCADQMEQHGLVLAQSQRLRTSWSRDQLLQRLDDNEQVLTSTCRLLTAEVKSTLRITPAGEWLLDNFYLVEEQVRVARKHLPTGYSRELPRLAGGPSANLPRVYDIALELISHGDGRVDAETLARFFAAYQTVTPLLLGELWAIPIMLRLALIENLRRVAARINDARLHLVQARDWADQMMAVAQSDPTNLILVIADMARSDPPMASPFVAELARRLQGHGPALAWPLTWIEQRLAESSLTIEQVVVAENQRQAADQVSISNSIGSLRFLGAMDWREFVEKMSCVESVLLGDPAGAYGRMDFLTRDHYRVTIDRLAKRCALSETQVARAAIDLAQANRVEKGSTDRASHVGYFLIDAGYARLEAAVRARLTLVQGLQRAGRRHALVLYLGSLLGLSCALGGALVWQAMLDGVQGWRLALLAPVALLAMSQLASTLTNWLVTVLVAPQMVPRMDFARGLPPAWTTLVAVPALLSSRRKIDELLEGLEVRFLGNHDPQLHLALITDYCDAGQETLVEDAALLLHARLGIEKLNAKYRRAGNDRFYLFHRPRVWNPAERLWMGYERKRGKLGALNAFLRGADPGAFSLIVGGVAALSAVRYVIALDSDTRLPRDSARQFVGAMEHPLNRPQFDESRGIVSSGYGILQPGMATSLSHTARSRYARLGGSEPGIDPYTRSVSDVYQDLFGEGSFIGKGIYDVDAFEHALAGRFPENRILSHDLLEGCYARSGLLSDVHLFEDCPASYLQDMLRYRRWMRGDWQIARWALRRVPDVDGRSVANPLSALSRWKILDNLRRSLACPALAMLVALGWAALPRAGLWTASIATVFLVPPLVVMVFASLRKPLHTRWAPHLGSTLVSATRAVALAGFRITCLPYEALLNLGIVARTLWRTSISHRRMLEWSVSDGHAESLADGILGSYRAMWTAPVAAAAVAVALGSLREEALAPAMPMLLLWLTAPAIAWWLGQAAVRSVATLSGEQEAFLRASARKTWAFFERFVTAEDHWLPPDNFQERPGPILAHRTSPTNIGLSLLANLAAFDFGYVCGGAFMARTDNAFRTLGSLERHQGHFFNWYDTRTLQPLRPRYISSVDSGNLAGHLMTLSAGLVGLLDRPLAGPRALQGLSDTLAVVRETDAIVPGEPGVHLQIARLEAILTAARLAPPPRLADLLQCLTELAAAAAGLDTGEAAPSEPEAPRWRRTFRIQCDQALADLEGFTPWCALAPAPAELAAEATTLVDFAASVSLRELAHRSVLMQAEIDACAQRAASAPAKQWLAELRSAVASAGARARERLAYGERLAVQANQFAKMDYEFLYDRSRNLLAIGYNVDEFRRDASHYDLLASEARLCTFVAIAQDQLPQESWFALGRLLTVACGEPVLLSWSGSMFEYLMPLLVMPTYQGTLLDQTCRTVVVRQIEYGKQRALPWGTSESGYNLVDTNLNYQYHAFGVPGLGLKRGLADDSVVAPYASVLALMIDAEQACSNLQRLAALGLMGRFGFYEAIDFTPSRLARGQGSSIVRSFMAHHQGMNLLALAHHLLDRPMQRRFVSVASFQATLLLLQERIPKTSVTRGNATEHSTGGAFGEVADPDLPVPLQADTVTPEVQLLSNGRYQVMVTNAGGGYSRWKDLALTRWREDATSDNWGSFLYVREIEGGEFWSAAFQPTLVRAESYEAIFSEGRAEFRRRDQEFETYSELVVSPEDDIELRRVQVSNRAQRRRSVEVTSYAEVVLATPAADLMQAAFGNLFVQTQILPERNAILCTRRPRSAGEAVPWMFHLFAGHAVDSREISYETDRVRFLGRGADAERPRALTSSDALSGTDGSVLDPICAIRLRMSLAGEQTATIDVVTGVAETRDACIALIDKYRDRHLADRVLELAMTHSGVTLRQINASEADARLYRCLAGSILYANASLRAEAQILMQNRRGQSGLWGYAISGDLPIVLLKIANVSHIELVRQMIQCHAYWRLKGLKVDLVIWNEEGAGYRARLQEQIMGLVANGVELHAMNRPGGIFVRSSAEQVSSEDRVLLHSVARAVLSGDRGTLADQVHRRTLTEKRSARLVPTRTYRPHHDASTDALPSGLQFANGTGGFTADGSEYLIQTSQKAMTPLPWVNVIANPRFGTVVSESGLGYTWSGNAHEFRLTPWSDDPVGTAGGEAIYLRDEETGNFWSPTPHPCRGAAPYISRHGFGYSVFEHTATGIRSELWTYVDAEETVKFSVLRVRNGSGRLRRLSATGYVEWVLGDVRSKTAMQVITEIDPASGALLARNAYSTDFGARVAFFDVDDASRTLSGDRTEFLGRNRTLRHPDAMDRVLLSGRLGAAWDPCGAIRVPFDLADGQEREIIFRLGAGDSLDQAQALALRLRQPGTARLALEKVRQGWRRLLGAVQIETPDPALNLLANGWLVYQTLSSRFWGRSGYYQSGGAYGFRDQLQDAMALVHAQPALLREHLLRCAARQYREGDVQHWWHPPSGRGVRTRCSDDFLWLPLAVSRYVDITGDRGVLDEPAHFLEGRLLAADEESYYDVPLHSHDTASLYEHCVRAIEHGVRFGDHGLPLMGSGDWNDGMNLVGIHGRGESVWLGFFFYQVLARFAGVADRHADAAFAARCRQDAERLRLSIEEHGWDGQWYRRAFFDDGTPLGASANDECQIDSIAQSWSVLSGAGEGGRARLAMDALDRRLVDREHRLIRLLEPPFDVSTLDPGYVKGYVPGVRENGGQYTHAAVWAAMAFAELGDGERAWELLDMIDPVKHARNPKEIATYKAEPYVVAADVYALAPHAGRGGWTWYTGSAGWMYRLILESILGLHREGPWLRMQPCLPKAWKGFSLRFFHGQTAYDVVVARSATLPSPKGTSVCLDGKPQQDGRLALVDDHADHLIEVHLPIEVQGPVAVQAPSETRPSPEVRPPSKLQLPSEAS